MNSNISSAWLRSKIAATSALQPVASKSFTDIAEESTALPYLVFEMLETVNESMLDPGEDSDSSFAYQVRIWASRRKDANSLRSEFTKEFSNVARTVIQDGQKRCIVEGSEISGVKDSYDPETSAYCAMLNVEIHISAC